MPPNRHERMFRLSYLVLLTLFVPTASAQISIESARAAPKGSVVTITGFVTAANEFGGPLYMQDASAGIAVYCLNLHTAAAPGDSIVVTGPLSEFGASSGKPGTGLFQISGADSRDPSCPDITYEVFKNVNRPPTPRVVTLADIGEAMEGQLVLVQDVSMAFGGSFGSNTNYPITDASGASELRIDNTTDLVGAPAPMGTFNMVGLVSQYRGDYQVLPRSTADLGVEGYTIPGEDVARELTLDVGTWNIRWFGDATQRPDDDDLQLQNAVRVLRAMQLDVIGLQEISNPATFTRLVDSLAGYRGILAPITQTQRTAILYKTATIDSVSAGFYVTSGDWASGRYPYAFTFLANLNGDREQFTLLNLHAKATLSATASTDYARRKADSEQLKAQLDARDGSENIIVVGDFNDDVDVSVVGNQPSPYANFVADAQRYRFLTASLSERGFQSISGGQMIDHILVSDEVLPFYFEGTERVENPSYVGAYLSTTSDHYPVWVRLVVGDRSVATVADERPGQALGMAYPTPTRGAVSIPFRLATPGPVEIAVFDLLGRRVATVQRGALPAGPHTATFDAAGLSTGVYLVRMTTEHGGEVTTLVRL